MQYFKPCSRLIIDFCLFAGVGVVRMYRMGVCVQYSILNVVILPNRKEKKTKEKQQIQKNCG